MADGEARQKSLTLTRVKREVTLARGVVYAEKSYRNKEGKNVDVYTVCVAPDAEARAEVAVTPWGTAATVPEQAAALAAKGKRVLAATNAGFFHLAAGTLDPYGMQIVEGREINPPSTDDPMHSDSFFGVTYEGKYVISDTAGYLSLYRGKLRFGIGGGYRHVVGGKRLTPPDTGAHPFTAVAVTGEGGFALVATDGRSERSADVSCYDMPDLFFDMGLDISDMMLLDGGGSTTVVTDEGEGLRLRNIPSDGALRSVSDIIAVVAKEN